MEVSEGFIINIEIYYFSGTGNSLHIANELQKRIPKAKLIPITRLLSNDKLNTQAQTVGFVFPIHLAMAPAPLIDFLKKLNLESVEYIFAVATRAGSQHRAFIDLEKILKRKSKSLDSFFTLNMASNDPKFEDWHRATDGELAKIEFEIKNKLNSIQKMILDQEKSRKKDTEYTVNMPVFSIISKLLPILNKMYNIEFYIDSKCKSCGTCENVCLSGKIKIVNGKPIWDKNVQCFLCNACLNYCPEHSIQIRSNNFLKSYTKVNERYFHPCVTADDIGRQKRNIIKDKL